MKHIICYLLLLLFLVACKEKKIEWVCTTPDHNWQKMDFNATVSSTDTIDVEILLNNEQQTIDGFGACFNEQGWASLNVLTESDREYIFNELFAPGVGANFTIYRMPVGANDFSLNWYSYNETEGDFGMNAFSVDNDRKTLIPFIKTALSFNPDLKIWASPWSPPSWMKYNKHYAGRSSAKKVETLKKLMARQNAEGQNSAFMERFKNDFNPKYQNDLPADKEGKEGIDMFIQKGKYFEAYALYFSKFIEEYRKEGIEIFAVMPQNEFNSAQVFPSCCWTAAGLSEFIGSYLGPAMESLGVDVYFGTMERPNEALVDTILQDGKSSKYIEGVGFQWAGKDALPGINKRYPDLKMFQTEQECGDGKNDWKGAMHSWELMKHYLNNGISVYEYWNTSLLEGGISRWGWAQNSLIVVNEETKDYWYTPEYYVLKHVSHFVLPGAKKLKTNGQTDDILAFKNADNSVVIIVTNQTSVTKNISIKIGDLLISPELPENSINTIKISNKY